MADDVDSSKPVVIVLPGIMGSHLADDDGRIWMHPRILGGAFPRLEVGNNDPANPGKARAESIFAAPYGDLCGHLDRDFHVVPFEYDWRMSIDDAADRLKVLVRNLLGKTGANEQPIHFLAHSMGGLVVQSFIANHKPEWEQVAKRETSRIVMMGTPLLGSYAIVKLFAGENSLVSMLAAPPGITTDGILKTIGHFPGLLGLLPQGELAAPWDFSQHGSWPTQDGDLVSLPEQAALDLAANRTSRLTAEDWSDLPVTYIHGLAKHTPASVSVVNGELKFPPSRKGDGQVLWELGDFPVERYFMPEVHGDMPTFEAAFDSISQLLKTGTCRDTHALSSQPPSVRDTVRDIESVSPVQVPDFLPTLQQLQAAALGGATGQSSLFDDAEPALNVSVVHGDLAFARNPVMVGHYVGDPIIRAEEQLDRITGGRLEQRRILGVYPGRFPSALIEMVHEQSPQLLDGEPPATPLVARTGAIVVGLGQAGELSKVRLKKSIIYAVLELAMQIRGGRVIGTHQNDDERPAIRLSTLLLGTGYGHLTVRESIEAIIDAIQTANRQLNKMATDDRSHAAGIPVCRELEIVEIIDRRAHQVLSVLRDLERTSIVMRNCSVDVDLHEREGRQRAGASPFFGGWWRRVSVTMNRRSTLQYRFETQRAAETARVQPQQIKLLRKLVSSCIQSTVNDDTFRRTANTLFQELVPPELRSALTDGSGIVFKLNEAAAAIPWEALFDGRANEREPLSVSVGVIRQLISEFADAAPQDSTERTALVVGDPRSDFVPLPGAVQEAERVTQILNVHGVEVTSLIGKQAIEIMMALRDKQYRILHLAGHGVHEFNLERWREDYDEIHPKPATEQSDSERYHQPPKGDPCVEQCRKDNEGVSGMILGDDILLTPKAVKKIGSGIPELVFINCCHLAKTGSDDITLSRSDYNEFAANVGVQFMRMGVRAVIAAGWAVDDPAAETFPKHFYENLFSGKTFGESVTEARRQVWKQHSSSNTWAAYQCYGDPGWRLRSSLFTRQDPKKAPAPQPTTQQQAIDSIYNLRQSATAMPGHRSSRELAERLEHIENSLRSHWLNNAMVRAELGLAWAELAYFQKAHEHLDAAKAAGGEICFLAIDRSFECEYRVKSQEMIRIESRLAQIDLEDDENDSAETELTKEQKKQKEEEAQEREEEKKRSEARAQELRQ